MKKANQIGFPTLGKSVGLRFNRPTYDALRQDFAKDQVNEQFAFGLFSQAKTADGTILIVNNIILADKHDLSEQSGGGVAPTKAFQATAYMIAQQKNLGILDMHTHPFSKNPHFSSIDHAESEKNARYICNTFPSPITHAMVVFNSTATTHDAAVYDRSINSYRSIDYIEILGRKIEINRTGEAETTCSGNDLRYSRQAMIPGWDQRTLSRLKIAVVGLGGNGAQIIETLVSIGVGSDGWIAAIDPDVIEASNLPRIPYAFPENIGSPKSTVATQYAGRKNPAVKFFPYPCSVTEKIVIDRIKGASVIISAPDGDGVRKVCNELAVRYRIPLIDLGCDIQTDDEKILAGGQVRIVLPGDNACLVCCGGYDPAVAALELMDDARAAVHASQGYVVGHRDNPTPSISNLNAVTSQLGINALLGLVHGKNFGKWDYVHYDQLTAQTLTANTNPLDSCPLCSREGFIGTGDENDTQIKPSWNKMQAVK
jgi:molybdopterin/thiamine biosynthesis adenylyltransferase